jgi:hypothetical protein
VAAVAGLDLVSAFLLALAVFFGPSTIALRSTPRWASPSLIEVGVVAFVGVASFFTLSALLRGWLAYGVGFLFVVLAATTAVCVAIRRYWSHEFAAAAHSPAGIPALAIIALLSTAGIADCSYIFSAQNWGADGSAAHVVSPMQLDPRRNANVALALLRGSDTLFLPGSRLLHQVFWYHGGASLLGALPDELSRYHQMAGITLATGWVLYATMLWAVLVIRPGLLAWPIAAFAFAAILLLDGRIDDTNVLLRMIAGIDPTNPDSVNYLQYFSIKLLALTAPHHALFAAFFAGVVVTRLNSHPTRAWRLPPWAFLTVFATLTSPVLAAIAFPFYFAAESILWIRGGIRECLLRTTDILFVGVLAFAAHAVVLRFPLHELFLRTGAVELQTLWNGFRPPLRLAPGAFAIANGVVGALFTLGIALCGMRSVHRVLDARARRWLLVTGMATLLTFAFWNGVVTDVELRRHASMITAILASIFVVALFASLTPTLRQRPWIAALAFAWTATALAQDYRLTRSLTDPGRSAIATDIPWIDYYAANAYLRAHRQTATVFAASGEGIVLPIANEVATAIASKLAILAHQKVSPALSEFLNARTNKGAFDAGEITEQRIAEARKLGFDTVVWGPVEEHVWGFVGRNSLLTSARLIARFGQVGVFDLRSRQSGPGDEVSQFLENVRCEALARSDLRADGYRILYKAGEYTVSGSREGVSYKGDSLGGLVWLLQSRKCMDGRLEPVVIRPLIKQPLERYVNLSQGLEARQSSIAGAEITHGPKNALDGNIWGLRSDRQPAISHTAWEFQPWWEIDLGQSRRISTAQIWGEHEAFADRLTAFVVIVTDGRLPPRYDALRPPRAGRVFFFPGTMKTGDVLPISSEGRFLRIQLVGAGYFIASEVQVWGSITSR